MEKIILSSYATRGKSGQSLEEKGPRSLMNVLRHTLHKTKKMESLNSVKLLFIYILYSQNRFSEDY